MLESAYEKPRILLVDDNPGVLKLLGTLFAEQGMTVSLAASAGDAKAALDDQNWSFDLVLSDISMPGETGFDLLRWIKREGSPNPDLPVLLTTAQLPEAENRLKGLSMGAVDYVVRPIDLPELVVRAVHAIENFKRVRALELSLQDSENFALIGRLLAASHHEIKNIATLVNLAAGQAARSFTANAAHIGSEGEQALRNLSQATELLTDISRNVDNLLQPEATRVRSLDLNELLRDVAELVRLRVRPCRIEVRSSKAVIWAMAHALRVKQIMINLILNAHDAIEELQPESGGAIFVTSELRNGECCIIVTDNGIGFDAPAERHEFKPFSTTKKLRGGQGLGLWLCATLMRNMGGHLMLRSSGVGRGTEAILAFKASSDAPKEDDLDIAKYLAELDD